MSSWQRFARLAARLVPGVQPEPDGEAIELGSLNNDGTPADASALPPPPSTPHPREIERLAREAFRRIDCRMLSFVVITLFVVELDRVLFTLYKSYFEVVLGLTATQYSTIVLAREIGYILGQIPSNFMLNMFEKPEIYFGVITYSWAALQMLRASMTGFTTVFVGFLISGILESAFLYPSREIGKKVGLLVSIPPIVRILLAAAGEPVPGDLSLRYRIYLTGLGGILITFYTLCLQDKPNLPRSTRWLQEAERRVILSSLAESYGWPHPDSYENEQKSFSSSVKGFLLASIDSKTWILAAICFCVSFPITWLSDLRHLIQILLPITEYSLISIAVSATLILSLCAAYIGGFVTSIFKKRGLIIAIAQGLAFLGCGTILQTVFIVSTVKVPGPAQFLFLAAFISLPAAYLSLATALTWALNCMPWDQSKRAACIAIVTTLLSTTNIFAIFLPPLDTREEGRSLNKTLVGLLMILIIGTLGSVLLLRLTLHEANEWLNRNNEPNPQPNLHAGRWSRDARFHDPGHTFRFPI
ncbi:MFS general substrate transporter [Hypoxylon sp. FL0543]|nr:MFS general substrate transporter [Hypoxylon sp. FL0543]